MGSFDTPTHTDGYNAAVIYVVDNSHSCQIRMIMFYNDSRIRRVVAQPQQVAFEAPLFDLCPVGACELHGEKRQLK